MMMMLTKLILQLLLLLALKVEDSVNFEFLNSEGLMPHCMGYLRIRGERRKHAILICLNGFIYFFYIKRAAGFVVFKMHNKLSTPYVDRE